MMNETSVDFVALISEITIVNWMRAAVYLIVGYVLARLCAPLTEKAGLRFFSQNTAALFRKIVFYLILLLFLIITLEELGFNLAVIIGALGIFSIAIGFASQTSISNIISGLFLITERSFKQGDTIMIKGISGEVVSIDLLSIKLKTPDNLLVRIPNENAIKAEITNISHYNNRRYSLLIGVDYATDLTTAMKLLLASAAKNQYCLKDPEPTVVINSFGASAINLELQAWCNRNDYTNLQTTLQENVKTAFEKAKIIMPLSSYFNDLSKILSN